ncbi:ParM/StbA family protein, partial [Ruthenibacterium lactatiformans]|uniref:ParM/StbA family protein n=1 Tax=Ruthenibacterium lactatiformans TaxID=1550024 RepID=UPI0022E490B2
MQRDKTASENYYLLTLAAIAKELRQRRMEGQCSVTLAAGLPLTGFGREKGAFEKYLRRSSQPVKYLITGEPSVLLMDIGGWTVDLMRLDNAVPNADTCRSLEWGMIRCLDGAREQVRRTMGLSVTDAQIERVLSGLPCALDEKAREVIRQQGRIYTEHLLSAVMEAGFDLKAMPVVILGGGASVVTRYVREDDRLCRMIPLHDSR